MTEITGHVISLPVQQKSAVSLRLPAELRKLLESAAQAGERVAFRVSERNGNLQVKYRIQRLRQLLLAWS